MSALADKLPLVEDRTSVGELSQLIAIRSCIIRKMPRHILQGSEIFSASSESLVERVS